MNYYIARAGQTYGPYTIEVVHKYVSEGSISPTDMARTESMQNWVPLGQLLNPNPATPAQAQAPPAGVIIPPDLHWALVLLFTMLTGLFMTIWIFVQSNFVRSIDPTSRATRDYIIAFLLPLAGMIPFGISIAVAIPSMMAQHDFAIFGATSVILGGLVFLAFLAGGVVFHIKAIFGIKASLERHYNTVEPINLRLSPVMTFFFNVLYFQYHFSRIADWKRTGVLRA